MDRESNAKLLDLYRCAKGDVLSYSIKESLDEPLGLFDPCVIVAKLTLQKLWTRKLIWEESVPSGLATGWIQFRKKLPNFMS